MGSQNMQGSCTLLTSDFNLELIYELSWQVRSDHILERSPKLYLKLSALVSEFKANFVEVCGVCFCF